MAFQKRRWQSAFAALLLSVTSLFGYDYNEVFTPFQIWIIYNQAGVTPLIQIQVIPYGSPYGDPTASITFEPIKITLDGVPTEDLVIPLKVTYTPSSVYLTPYQPRLIGGITQSLLTLVSYPNYYKLQLAGVQPPQNGIFYFYFGSPVAPFVTWLGDAFPLVMSPSWASDMLFSQSSKSATTTVPLTLPATSWMNLPPSVYWGVFQWNMEPAGAVAQTLYNLQVIQYGLFLGANQQINALLSPKNSASFQATLETNLAYANRQLADLKKVNPSL